MRYALSFGFNSVQSDMIREYLTETDSLFYGNVSYKEKDNLEWTSKISSALDLFIVNINQDKYCQYYTVLQMILNSYSNCHIMLCSRQYTETACALVTKFKAPSVILQTPFSRGLFIKKYNILFSPQTGKAVSLSSLDIYEAFINDYKKTPEDQIGDLINTFIDSLAPEPAIEKQFRILADTAFCELLKDISSQKSADLIDQHQGFLEKLKTVSKSNEISPASRLMRDYLLNCHTLCYGNKETPDIIMIRQLKDLTQKMINENEPLSLETAAKRLYISPSYLSHKFKQHEGCCYKQYVTNQRLIKAKDLLISSSTSIEEIAINCGYKETSSFSRAFKRKYHSSPKKFREEGRKKGDREL